MTVYSGRWGYAGSGYPDWPDPAESDQPLSNPAWTTVIPYNVLVDTDSIDNGDGTFTIAATGIYYLNFQSRGPSAATRVQIDGVTAVDGFNADSAGTDYGNATSVYVGCIAKGSVVELQAQGSTAHSYGYFTLFRVPEPYAVADLSSGTTDGYLEWQPVCDQPSWLDDEDATTFTIGADGHYFVSVQELAPRSGYDEFWRKVELHVNGSYVDYHHVSNPYGNDNIPLTTVLELAAGDTLQVHEYMNTADPIGVVRADILIFKIPDFSGALITLDTVYNPDTNWNDIPFDTEVYDTDGYWPASGTSELVAPADGIYLVYCGYTDFAIGGTNFNVSVNPGSAGPFSSSGRIPGDDFLYGATGSEFSQPASPTTVAIFELAEGDSVLAFTENGNGGNANGYDDTVTEARFGMFKIGDWTFRKVTGCPCPRKWVPQIYRVKRP